MSQTGTAPEGGGEPLFEAFLNRHDDQAWREIIWAVLPSIHPVDRTATVIWFHFFPLALHRALKRAEDPQRLAQRLSLDGRYLLEDQIDSSHEFFYGHQFWPLLKAAVSEMAGSAAAPPSLDLATLIGEVAARVAKQANADPALVMGIAAVAFRTLQQVGSAAFNASPGTTGRIPTVSPEEVLRQRARDDRQGLFSFLRPEKQFTVTFNEREPSAKFKLINTQHLTTAAANDKRDHYLREPRCIPGEGPIPVQCRSASCGTCWVGVLAGAEKLSEVRTRERQRIREFGYIDTEERRPLIRLACQAQAFGNVSIVIPPWNGVFGDLLREDAGEDQERILT
jgi:ferredoxin